MSNTAPLKHTQTALSVTMFDPDDLILNPELEQLRITRDPERIAALAKMILEEGQSQPGAYRETEDGYELVYGYRRLAAIKLLRSQGHPEIQYRAERVDATDDQALRLALGENIHHEGFTPIELAKNMQLVRTRFGWKGQSGTAKVAEFCGVSQATVTQAERLLTLDQSVQDQVHQGEMRPAAALELLAAKPAKRKDVLAKATEIAASDPQAAPKAGKATKADKPSADTAKGAETGKATAKKAAVKVQGKHIRQAIKEVKGAADKQKAAKLPEVKALIDTLVKQGSHFLLEIFLGKFQAFMAGKLAMGNVVDAWEDIADQLPKTAKPVPAAASAKAVPGPVSKSKAVIASAKAKLDKSRRAAVVVVPAVKKADKPRAKSAATVAKKTFKTVGKKVGKAAKK